MHIICYPANSLREVSEPVSEVDKGTKRLSELLIHKMIKKNGLGLAAPQVGINERIITIRANARGGIVLINPEIVEYSDDTFKMVEGCLSIPGEFYEIERPRKIRVSYVDIHGEEQELVAEDYASSVIQHEIDHLDGKLIIDYISNDKQQCRNATAFFA